MAIESTLTVARLVATLGKIEGRKRVQKMVFLLKSKGFADFDQQFLLHYYGPFSRQLAGQLDFLCQADLVEEKRAGDTYTYTPTTDEGGKRCIEELSEGHATPKWSRCAKLLDQKGTCFLEALSTLVYLRKRGCTGTRLRREFLEIKPKLKSQFQEAGDYARAEGWL